MFVTESCQKIEYNELFMMIFTPVSNFDDQTLGTAQQFYLVESKIDAANRPKRKPFAATIRIRIFLFLIIIQTAVYAAERFTMHWNFSDPTNPRFVIESGFKSRAGYNGVCTLY